MTKSEAAKPAAKTVRNMVPLKNMVQGSQSSRGKKSSQSIEEIAAATSRVRLSATFLPLPTRSSASVSHVIDASFFLRAAAVVHKRLVDEEGKSSCLLFRDAVVVAEKLSSPFLKPKRNPWPSLLRSSSSTCRLIQPRLNAICLSAAQAMMGSHLDNYFKVLLTS